VATLQQMTFSQLESRAQKEKQALIDSGGKLEGLKMNDFSKASREALKDSRLQAIIKRILRIQ
jgi:uncharacterized protein (DUF1778 family)